MRLSSMTGDYSQVGGVIDSTRIVGAGGETEISLKFVDGSEEVYLDGARLFKGSEHDYVTDEANGKILLNVPLSVGQKLIGVGRTTANDIPFTRGTSESVVLTDGQTTVELQSVNASTIDVYISGPMVDRGRLLSPIDFTVTSDTTIELTHTFPEGSVLEVIESNRLAWVDPDNLVVNDGGKSKSLSARFRDTQESAEFFIQTNGAQLQDIHVGLLLQRWAVTDESGIPRPNDAGIYPVLRLGNSYWNPPILNELLNYNIINWKLEDDIMKVTCIDTTDNNQHILNYDRRVLTSYRSTDADQLGGKDASYYRNANNINDGEVSSAHLPKATADKEGIIRLSSSVDSNSIGEAATPFAVKKAYDLAAGKLGATQTSQNTFRLGGQYPEYYTNADNLSSGAIPSERLPLATTAQSGIVRLSSSLTSTSPSTAATSAAVKSLKDAIDTKVSSGGTAANSSKLDNQPRSFYQNASNLNAGQVSSARLPIGTTAVTGIVRLNNATNSSSTTQAATAAAVKSAYDLAAGKSSSSHTHDGRYLRIDDGKVSTSSGTIYATNFVASSDRRLKDQIEDITSALSKVKAIQGKKYVKGGEVEYGVIAQDIQEILPDLVKEDDNEMLGVAYLGLIPILIEAVKELSDKLEA